VDYQSREQGEYLLSINPPEEITRIGASSWAVEVEGRESKTGGKRQIAAVLGVHRDRRFT
jgi:hypothetical protein